MFKSAATKLAHNTTVPGLGGNKDLRPLQDLITAEKQVLISLQKLSTDYAKAADALRVWGSGEGEDLGDTLTSSATLLTLFATSLSHYASLSHPMRDLLKSIRTKEENLDELKRRRKSLVSKADSAEKKLSRMDSGHKNYQSQMELLNSIRDEIRNMDSEIMSEEAYVGDLKREVTKKWVGLKFSGLVECCEKGTIAGEYGTQITLSIPLEHTQPGAARSLYYGRPKVESLLNEALRCINEVKIASMDNLNSPPGTQGHGGQSFGAAAAQGGDQFPTPPQQGQFLPPTWSSSQPGSPVAAPGSPSQHQFGHLQQQWTGASGPGGPGLQQQYTGASTGTGTGGNPPFLPPIRQQSDFSASTPTGYGDDNINNNNAYPNAPNTAYPHTISAAASYPQNNSNQGAVDDFGQISSPIDNPWGGGPSGGRFATFPVKQRPTGIVGPGQGASGPGVGQHNTGSGSGSFSSSVMDALRSSQSPPGTQPQFEGRPGFGLGNNEGMQGFGALGGAGAGHGPHTPGEQVPSLQDQQQRYAPPEGPPPGFTGSLPPGAALPQHYQQSQQQLQPPHTPMHDEQQRISRGDLEEDVTLAYANDPSVEAEERREVRAEEGSAAQVGGGRLGGGNHVRFGGEGHGKEESFDPYRSHQQQQQGLRESPPLFSVQEGKEREVGKARERESGEMRYPSGPPQYEELQHRYEDEEDEEEGQIQNASAVNVQNQTTKEKEKPKMSTIPDVPSGSPSPPPPSSTSPNESPAQAYAYANQKRVPVPSVDAPPAGAGSPEYQPYSNQSVSPGEYFPSTSPSSGAPGAGAADRDDYSDLSPPSAPFTRRGASPRPDFEALARQTESPQQSPVSRTRELDRDEGYAQGQGQGPSPLVPGVPRILTVTRDRDNDDAGGGIGGGGRFSPISTLSNNNSAYQTPNEYPARERALGGTGATASFNKSSSSLGSSNLAALSPGGARTISAAAFRRPQRVASGNTSLGGELPVADTSPLALKKRLPTSPYPGSRDPNAAAAASTMNRERDREGSPRPTARSAYPGGRDGSPKPGSLRGRTSREGSPRPSLLERKRSGSIPRAPEGPPPSHALPPIPSAGAGAGGYLQAGAQGGEEDYDYLGAYVHTGVTPVPEHHVPGRIGQQQQQYGGQYGQYQSQGGYGDGRYATNLEDSGLR